MHASIHTCTRLGGAHERNQDRALVGAVVHATTSGIEHAAVDAPAIVGVFDGLGGHVAGDVASDLAAKLVAEANVPDDEESVTELLRRADDLLVDAMRAQPEHAGMGTTAALLVLRTGGAPAMIANVGDSTIWWQHGDSIEEISVSDRWQGSGVLQCLGANEDGIVPHVRSLGLQPGDRLLVATDGLTDVVPAEVLHEVLSDDARDAAERLLELVEGAGVPDDLTFLIADLRDGTRPA